MSKRSKSYYQLIEAAIGLFQKHGIKKINVEEICAHASVSKMTFYRNFSNKEDALVHALSNMNAENMERYNTIMEQDISFPEKIKQVVELKHEASKHFSDEFIRDILMSDNEQVRKEIERERVLGMQVFRTDLERAQKEGWIRKSFSVDFLMYYLEGMQQKMVDQRMFQIFPSTDHMIDALTDLFFYGIIDQENAK